MALPRRTTGSLSPIFILARPVCLAIKLSFAFTLYVRFPTVLREPLSASVTFWERPPQSNCPPDSVPRPDSWPMVRVPVLQGWYPKDGSAKTGVLVSKPPTYPVHVVPRPNVKLQ